MTILEEMEKVKLALKRSLSNLNQIKVRERLLPESYDYTNTNILSKTNLKISTARIQIFVEALKGYLKIKCLLNQINYG